MVLPLEQLKPGSHDLNLPDWGPYTKSYAGISHIPDRGSGMRFDLSVFPGLYRRKIGVPNVLHENDYHIWEAAGDLSYFSTRHEVEWKDRVYCDISFSRLEKDAYLIRTDCVNHTDQMQNMVLHYMASIHYPHVFPNSFCYEKMEAVRKIAVGMPQGAVSVRAIDYEDMRFAVPRPTDSLTPDGRARGEERTPGFTGGSGLLLGTQPGDWARYRVSLEQPLGRAALVVRYRSAGDADSRFSIDLAPGVPLCFVSPADGGDGIGVAVFPLGKALDAGEICFTLTAADVAPVLLDSLVLCEEAEAGAVSFEPEPLQYVPQVWADGNTAILKYEDADPYYGIYWDFPDFWLRRIENDELDIFLPNTVHHHTQHVLTGNERGCFINAYLRSIPVEPGQDVAVYGLVCQGGSKAEVEETLARLARRKADFESLWEGARRGVCHPRGIPAGDAYRLGQERMMATTLTNVVYPVYTKKSYIRHNTPGRWWDTLYTWDSGFVGLGLAQLAPERALDCLYAYTTEPGDEQSAFIHHGSPVPVQFYLLQELFNRSQSVGLLDFFYPRMKQYYEFMVGRHGSSTTASLSSGLLKTWDYFYNSGGWDDYPPQVAVHRLKLEATVAPVSITCHVIRCAKILSMAARLTGKTEEAQGYQEDIQRLSQAVETAWDASSGYYGYLCHDEQKKPTEILRHESGENYNMGMDGVYPLVADICGSERAAGMLDYLLDPARMWTPIGLSTVDQSASYYKKDGYWNGAVWMPHQWFFFKAMLDYGRADSAFQVAETALKLWQNEVSQSYNCFEHFIIQSGRGAGWHHFSGLSTPVLMWYQNYFVPGNLTCGHSGFITKADWAADFTGCAAHLEFSDGHPKTTVVAVLNPDYEYEITSNQAAVSSHSRFPGVYEIELDSQARPDHELLIIKKQR